MNTSSRSRVPLAPPTILRAGAHRRVVLAVLALALIWAAGCNTEQTLFPTHAQEQQKETPRTEAVKPVEDPEQPEDKSVYKLPPVPDGVKRKQFAPDLFFETEGDKRRVVVVASVCLRDRKFLLEGLLTRKGKKEHEYPLAVDIDAEKIHTLLLLAGAEPGSPVSFAPKYSPACGTPIKLTIRYVKDGKLVSVPAQQWIRDTKTKKVLAQDWVFGGSRFEPDLDDPKKKNYLANDGDLVCVANMESAMLDLPVMSARGLEDRSFEANSEHIPPLDTRVELVFEPVLAKK